MTSMETGTSDDDGDDDDAGDDDPGCHVHRRPAARPPRRRRPHRQCYGHRRHLRIVSFCHLTVFSCSYISSQIRTIFFFMFRISGKCLTSLTVWVSWAIMKSWYACLHVLKRVNYQGNEWVSKYVSK